MDQPGMTVLSDLPCGLESTKPAVMLERNASIPNEDVGFAAQLADAFSHLSGRPLRLAPRRRTPTMLWKPRKCARGVPGCAGDIARRRRPIFDRRRRIGPWSPRCLADGMAADVPDRADREVVTC